MSNPVKTPLYIGISGKARAGKNTVAQAIHELAPSESTIIGFADALKAYCRVAYAMTTKDAPLLQSVGVGLRQSDDNVWIRVLRDTAVESGYPIVLVPDVRFKNEAQFIKDAGGLLVRVVRPGFVADDRPADHVSEVDLDDFEGWDTVISTDSVFQLRRAAKLWFFELKTKRDVERVKQEIVLATMPPLPAEEAA